MTKTIEPATASPRGAGVGYDPIEDRLRASVRATGETMFEEELAESLGRLRYDREEGRQKGCPARLPCPPAYWDLRDRDDANSHEGIEDAFRPSRLRTRRDHFGRIEDPRAAAKLRYPLGEVMFLVVATTVADCENVDEIALWGQSASLSAPIFGVPLRHRGQDPAAQP